MRFLFYRRQTRPHAGHVHRIIPLRWRHKRYSIIISVPIPISIAVGVLLLIKRIAVRISIGVSVKAVVVAAVAIIIANTLLRRKALYRTNRSSFETSSAKLQLALLSKRYAHDRI